MRVEQQPGYILHARPWRETSLLLEVFSRDYGRVGLVARGMRRERSRTPRALLQPLTPVCLAWSGRGELSTLTGVEAAGGTLTLRGEMLLCALYLNELIARLIARDDPQPEVFFAYVDTLAALANDASSAWALRRFERDLLMHLGYGLVLDAEIESGMAIDPQASYGYRLDAGPITWHHADDGLKLRGSALLALADDTLPDAADLAALRRLMRALIAHHLDGAGLRAWGMFATAPR